MENIIEKALIKKISEYNKNKKPLPSLKKVAEEAVLEKMAEYTIGKEHFPAIYDLTLRFNKNLKKVLDDIGDQDD